MLLMTTCDGCKSASTMRAADLPRGYSSTSRCLAASSFDASRERNAGKALCSGAIVTIVIQSSCVYDSQQQSACESDLAPLRTSETRPCGVLSGGLFSQ